MTTPLSHTLLSLQHHHSMPTWNETRRRNAHRSS